MTDAPARRATSTALARILGPVDATCIVIGAVIGVGIFFTPSRVAVLAGSGTMALAAWAAGGVVAMLGALAFAALGRRYTGSGAQYEILRDAYGPLPAFVFVFCNATAIQAGATAIIAVVCAQNLGVLCGGAAPSDGVVLIISAVMIVGLTGANVCGARLGSGIANLTAAARVLTLVAIVGVALVAKGSGPSASPVAAAPDQRHGAAAVLAFLSAMTPTCFCYGGWQHLLWIAGEVRDARRNVPRAIVGGMLVVVTTYVTANWAFLHLIGYDAVAGSATLAADAVGAAWPGGGRRAVAGAVAVSAFGVLNAQLLSGPRLVYGMAADGRFFAAFARVGERFHTPHAAIMLIGGIAMLLLVAAGQRAVDIILTGVVAIDGTFFALTGLAVIILGRRDRAGTADRSLSSTPVVALLFVLAEVGVVAGAFWDPAVRQAAVIGAVWIAVAAGLYFARFRQAPELDGQTPHR